VLPLALPLLPPFSIPAAATTVACCAGEIHVVAASRHLIRGGVSDDISWSQPSADGALPTEAPCWNTCMALQKRGPQTVCLVYQLKQWNVMLHVPEVELLLLHNLISRH
jgi:hypothetical protein